MAEIRVQVCYARPDKQILRELAVEDGATVRAAIESSGVLRESPEIDLENCKVGIYGKLKALDTVLREHDRVEIYRPLIADPKESRRRRAEKKEEKKAG
ncbi:RnfH family protein [Herbaspirillum sp. HC18]|nr:RnfH family protein [Herbaspirillum sp. HC18]